MFISTRKLLFLSTALVVSQLSYGQELIGHWDFNSPVPDNDAKTGTISPKTGNGSLKNIGNASVEFDKGNDSDPATGDNSAWRVSNFPAANANNKTAGIEIQTSTVGYDNIQLSYVQRYSNTSPANGTIQYCLDVTAASPVWVDLDSNGVTVGDDWYERTFSLSSVSGVNNNPNVGLRIVAKFQNGTNSYAPAKASGNYATTGNWRFDLLSVKGTVLGATAPQEAKIVIEKTTITKQENDNLIQIIAQLDDNIDSNTSATLVFNPKQSTLDSNDIVFPAKMTFNWKPNSKGVNDTITLTIVDDAIAENAEYGVFTVNDLKNVKLDNSLVSVFVLDNDKKAPEASKKDFLKHITSFSNGKAGDNSAEIIAYESLSKRLFIANSIAAKIDIFDFKNPASPTLIKSVELLPTYGNINSVASKNGIVAASIEATNPQENGKVVFFDSLGEYLNDVEVGAMPDMITFNHDGTLLLTANEGEPNKDYSVDPEGSISIVKIQADVRKITAADVTHITFEHLNPFKDSLNKKGIRIFGPNATVAQDLEPEYIAISDDNTRAYVTLQENNAIAEIDLTNLTLVGVTPLGFKDHMLPANALDVNDKITDIVIANWPVKGVYMPDAIASYQVDGVNYYITANEGDAREYGDFEEGKRLGNKNYLLDTTVFKNIPFLKEHLARLNVTTASGDHNKDGYFEEIYIYGARSFTIWNGTTHELVYDNGQDFELITSQSEFKSIFNASNSNSDLKNRSDDKGPEPEGVTVANINDRHYAFIGLERIGGCMVYDVTDPKAPFFVDYKNIRKTDVHEGDLGAEGIIYIDSLLSPDGKHYVLVANEVSSTVTVFEVNAPKSQGPPPANINEIQANVVGFVYPNPAQQQIHVVLSNIEPSTVLEVYNVSGQLVEVLQTNNAQSTIDIANYASGTYIIKVNSSSYSGQLKFQKLQ